VHISPWCRVLVPSATMTDQITRIERMVSKLLEAAGRIEDVCNQLSERLPEELYDLKEELKQTKESLRDKCHDERNYGIGGEGL
jgi:hypothetical protein